ncbi:MAG: DUF305 domain-containing protein [Gammaproteobacteria bacterium]
MSEQEAGSENEKVPAPAASTTAYRKAATQMHLDMAVAYTGDADKDFAAVLAAHRRGAIALARIQLQYGKDPEMRRTAEQILAADEQTIARMQAWQAAHP